MLEIERGDVQYLFRRRPNLMARIQQRAKLSYDLSWTFPGPFLGPDTAARQAVV